MCVGGQTLWPAGLSRILIERRSRCRGAALRRSFRHLSRAAGILSRAARCGSRERSAAGWRAGKTLPQIRLMFKEGRRRWRKGWQFSPLHHSKRSRGGAGLGSMLGVLLRKGVGTARGRSLFSRGYVRYGEGQTPGRRIFVDCPFLGCCGCLGRGVGQAVVVRMAGPVGLCLCRCGLCRELGRPQTAGVLDDRVRPGAGEVNRNGDLLMKVLCGGWGVGAGLGDG